MNFKTLTRFFLLSFFILVSVVSQGCFEYEEKIIMKNDGSGELFIHYQTERDMKFETLYFPTDIYEVKYNIEKNYERDGLKSQSQKVIQKEDVTHVYMDFNFENLSAFNDVPRFENEEFNRSEKEQLVSLQ